MQQLLRLILSALLSSRSIWVGGLFCLLILAVPSNGQSCGTVTTNLCRPFVPPGSVVYVPPGLTLSIVQDSASKLVSLLNVPHSATSLPEPCRTYGLQLICGTWLRPCLTVNNVSLPIPEELCLDTCLLSYEACVGPVAKLGFAVGLGVYFPPGTSSPLNCTSGILDRAAYNMSFFPNGTVESSYNGTNYTVPCSQPDPGVVPAPVFCEPPLVLINKDGFPGCALTCPLPALTDSEYDNVKLMQGILGWMSWVTTAILILVLVVVPKARAFPRNLVMMTALAAHIAAAAIILPTYAGYENTWCGGTDTYLIPSFSYLSTDAYGLPEYIFNVDESVLDFQSSLCTFQGAMLQFGFLAAVFWWAIIAFNMCLELYFGKLLSLEQTKWKWIRFGIYNNVVWGVAFILMVIPAAAGKIKFAPSGSYCFVSGEDNYAWSLTFWFIPVGVSMLLGVILFVLALIRITIIFITLRKVKKMIWLYLRLTIFILLYLILFVFIFAYNINFAANSSNINSAYQAYYECLLYGEPNCSLSDSITGYNLVMLKGFAISSLGVLLFCLFVISWDVIRFWGDLFTSFYFLLKFRKKENALSLMHLVVGTGTARSLTESASMTITAEAPDNLPEQEGEEMSEVEDSSSSAE